MKRRRRRRIQITVMYFIILILLVIIGIGTFLSINAFYRNSISGTWVQNQDMSESIKLKVNSWLDNEEEIDFTFTPVKTTLVLEKDGSYTMTVDEESYRTYVSEAYEYVKKRFSSVVEANLLMAGYSGSEDIEAVSEQLIEETVGGELGQYLEDNGVAVVKPMDQFGGFVSSGAYEFSRKNKLITFTDGTGTVSEYRTSLTADTLVLTGSSEEAGEGAAVYPITFSRVEENE